MCCVRYICVVAHDVYLMCIGMHCRWIVASLCTLPGMLSCVVGVPHYLGYLTTVCQLPHPTPPPHTTHHTHTQNRSLPRVGLSTTLGWQHGIVTWYGRGPHECYPDRKTAAHVGRYSMGVEGMHVPYIVPGVLLCWGNVFVLACLHVSVHVVVHVFVVVLQEYHIIATPTHPHGPPTPSCPTSKTPTSKTPTPQGNQAGVLMCVGFSVLVSRMAVEWPLLL